MFFLQWPALVWNLSQLLFPEEGDILLIMGMSLTKCLWEGSLLNEMGWRWGAECVDTLYPGLSVETAFRPSRRKALRTQYSQTTFDPFLLKHQFSVAALQFGEISASRD